MIVYHTQHQHKGQDDMKDKVDNKRKQGVPKGFTDTYSGKLTENLCQAIARDVLCDGMRRAKEAGLRVSFHVHDEIVVECTPSDGAAVRSELEALMSISPSWAPGLTLGAEAYLSPFYRKEPKKPNENAEKNISKEIDQAA
jgi:hypothetical protein